VSDDETRRINTIRFLSVDMVEKAKSGHPGLPLGAAPMAYVLWDRFLRHNPKNPAWPNRDRFVLSAGHGSALLYSLLHLTGYDLPLSELQRFRQWGSRTPGHPELHDTPGVEATTGPLGQGFGMGVGMAMAERFLRETFEREGLSPVDHYTYALCSDGDLMEGISSEAASLAGTTHLGRLVYLYDDNQVSLEGRTNFAFTEDVAERFLAYGWRVDKVADGNDLGAIHAALESARAGSDRPSLVIVRTHIGYGSPKQDTHEAHGEPLGPDATRATKEKLGWPTEPAFLVPDDVRTYFRRAVDRGAAWEREWAESFGEYRRRFPDAAEKLDRAWRGLLPDGWDRALPRYGPEKPIRTRDAGGQTLNALSGPLWNLFGGSADLNPSTKTYLKDRGDFGLETGTGRNVHFGVREHAMVAAVNGIALHGGVLPYSATFLIFSDYARPAIRLGALMGVHALYVFTHDSVGLGEDGPTHQPIEHYWALRSIPRLVFFRPADANETVEAFRWAVAHDEPTVLALTRQDVPVLDPAKYAIREGVPRGGYVLEDGDGGRTDLVLIGTGSEVQLLLGARERLLREGVRARVVSMPSTNLFDRLDRKEREAILPPRVPKLVVEAGVPGGWWKYLGGEGDVIGLERFGASAPGGQVLEKLGFTVDHVVDRARALARRRVAAV
jgi:transketolase